MKWILWYFVIINICAFILCGEDKRRAKKYKWRIPEKTLFISAILGGSPGLLIGMKTFHHKTQHKSFTIGVPAILAAQLFIVSYLAMRFGGAA